MAQEIFFAISREKIFVFFSRVGEMREMAKEIFSGRSPSRISPTLENIISREMAKVHRYSEESAHF